MKHQWRNIQPVYRRLGQEDESESQANLRDCNKQLLLPKCTTDF